MEKEEREPPPAALAALPACGFLSSLTAAEELDIFENNLKVYNSLSLDLLLAFNLQHLRLLEKEIMVLSISDSRRLILRINSTWCKSFSVKRLAISYSARTSPLQW